MKTKTKQEKLKMKGLKNILGMIALTVLVSCGGSGSGGKAVPTSESLDECITNQVCEELAQTEVVLAPEFGIMMLDEIEHEGRTYTFSKIEGNNLGIRFTSPQYSDADYNIKKFIIVKFDGTLELHKHIDIKILPVWSWNPRPVVTKDYRINGTKFELTSTTAPTKELPVTLDTEVELGYQEFRLAGMDFAASIEGDHQEFKYFDGTLTTRIYFLNNGTIQTERTGTTTEIALDVGPISNGDTWTYDFNELRVGGKLIWLK